MAAALRIIAATSLNPEPLLLAARQIETDGQALIALRAEVQRLREVAMQPQWGYR
jgi:hypothetical protein